MRVRLSGVERKAQRLRHHHHERAYSARRARGQYNIVAIAEDGVEKHRGTFEVAQFELPDMQLQIELKPDIAFRGDTIKGVVHARHYFGSAVKDEIVRITMPDGRLLEGRTDADGSFAFTQETAGFQPGAWLSFNAQLPSKNISAAGATMLHTTGVQLEWDRLPETVVAGVASTLRVKAKSPDGKPLATTARLTIYRREKTESNDVLGGLPGISYLAAAKEPAKISEVEIKTEAKTGIAIVPFTLAAGGDHTFVVEAKDARGNPASLNGGVFASADDDAVKLRLFADETEVDEGAAFTVRAHSRIEAPLALVTIAGEDIIEHRIVPLKPGHNALGVNVASTHWPRFDVTVAFLDGQKLHRARETVAVKRQLKLTITPPADTLETGSEAEIKLSATDQQGHPVKAELSLALVNDALFAQHPDAGGDIVGFFQRGSRTGSSYRFDSSAAFTHRAKSRQVQIAIEGAAPRTVAALNHVDRIRALEALEKQVYQQGQQVQVAVVLGDIPILGGNFPVTPTTPTSFEMNMRSGQQSSAEVVREFIYPNEFEGFINYGSPIVAGRSYFWTDDASAKLNLKNSGGGAYGLCDAQWHCPIVTDATGNASVKLKLPEQHGSWRLGAKGCTANTLVGAAEKHIITRKSLFIVLQQPVALREGDVWRPEVVVHALDGAERDVKVVANLQIPDGEKKMERTAHVKAGQSVSVFFDEFTVPTDKMVLRWSAELQDGAARATASSAVMVLPWQVARLVNGGVAAQGSVKVRVELPQGEKHDRTHRVVSLHLSAADWLFDMALNRMPNVPGVSAPPQTAASSLLSAVSALRVAKASKASADRIAVLEGVIRDLIAELQITQRDGGWSWQGVKWDHDSIVTSLGLWGLREAATLGFTVDEATIKSAVKYLKAALAIIPPGEPEKAAVILHALALEKEADFSVANRLYRDRATLNHPALAFLAGAFLRMDRAMESKELLEMLAKKSEGKDGAFACEGSKTVARLSSYDDIAAIVLWTISKGNPQSPVAEKAMQRLLTTGGAQSPLQGLWTAALAEYFLARTDSLKPTTFAGELYVNGKLWRKIVAADQEKITSLVVPEEMMKSNDETVIELRGPQHGVFVHVSLVGLQFNPIPGRPNGWFDPEPHQPLVFQIKKPDEKPIVLPSIKRRVYLHDTLRHKDMPLRAASTSPAWVVAHGQTVRVEVDVINPEKMRQSYFVLEETIPAGSFVLDGSITSNHVKMEPTAYGFRLWFKPGRIESVRYSLVARNPGIWNVPPDVLRDACETRHYQNGPEAKLTVLPPGETPKEKYEMNRDEHFELATKLFEENNFTEARVHLDKLRGDVGYERDVARMLLWIFTASPEGEYARQIVEVFETLSERHADLVIPFDKILRVAVAYRQIAENERAWLVERATIESSFVRDARVSAALRDAGDFLGGAEHQLALGSEYPDVPDVLLAFFSLAQDFQDKAADAASLTVRAGAPKPTKTGLLERSRDLLRRYLIFYADDAAADGAAFNLSNVFFDLNDYAKVAVQAESAIVAYPKSTFLSSFQYMSALGHFWQYEFPKAISAAAPVATGNSNDAPNARYITAQIYDAQGHPQEAIDWYKKVRDEFPDAGESISYLEEKRVMLPPATTVKPGQPVKLELSSRNVKEAALKVYKVDLLKLHDRSSNLSDVTKVNLAGITPEAEMKVALGEGKDFAWKRRMLELPVKNEGAYLVICRGDDLFTSALVLVTPLELEVHEDQESGAVRVQVKDAAKGNYLADAETKIIDSTGGTPTAGRTDPRGIFQGSDVSGFATVVVKHGDTRYAYYKSATMLRPAAMPAHGQGNQPNAENAPADPFAASSQPNQSPNIPQAKTMSKKAYFQNVKEQLKGNAIDNKIQWEEKMSKGGKGVEVQKAMKK